MVIFLLNEWTYKEMLRQSYIVDNSLYFTVHLDSAQKALYQAGPGKHFVIFFLISGRVLVVEYHF